jgi:hypothetical protein
MASDQGSTKRVSIPDIQCPQCDKRMRLVAIEAPYASPLGRESFIFECACGHAHRQPTGRK